MARLPVSSGVQKRSECRLLSKGGGRSHVQRALSWSGSSGNNERESAHEVVEGSHRPGIIMTPA